MTKSNISKIDLTFEFFDVDGEFMSLQVINGDNVYNLSPDNNTACLAVEFPTDVKLVVSGKNMDRDTKVDEDGNIVADKHIILSSVVIDRFTVNPEVIKTLPVFRTSDSEFKSSYFGFNGEVILSFDAKTALYWLIKNN